MKYKKFKLHAIGKPTKELQGDIKPAKTYIPSWFKNAPIFYPEKELKVGTGAMTNMTFKKCKPMEDSFNLGYMVDLQADVYLEQLPNDFSLTWKVDNPLFENHGNTTFLMDTPYGYHEQVVKYHWLIVPETPKGYSTLVVPPLGFHDNIFKAVPAVIDTDDYVFNFALPMWVSNQFKGIVPKGTPIAQLIPFKRDNWKSELDVIDDRDYKLHQQQNHNDIIINSYIKRFWKRKIFK